MKNLGSKWILLMYVTIIYFLRRIQYFLTIRLACISQNLFVTLIRGSSKFSYDKQSKLFEVKDGKESIFFADMERGFNFYSRGILKRGHSIAASYCLTQIKFEPEDIIVDCGANYGDLFIALSQFLPPRNYITFEPGPDEYRCLKLNIPEGQHINSALSDKVGSQLFYLSSSRGDSSLIEPLHHSKSMKVKTTTLDHFLSQRGLERCKLLKLEAEGCEPEILKGAKKFLKICEYVAVDGGKERGVEQSITLPEVNNILIKNGFRMIDLNGSVYRALYRKQ